MGFALNMICDLRTKFTQVRDQGPRPLCLAFALSDLNSFSNQLIDDLSVEYLAHHAYKIEKNRDFSTGLMVSSVIEAIASYGQPSERELPYDPVSSSPELPQINFNRLFYSTLGETSDMVSSLNAQLEKAKASAICITLPKSFFTVAAPFELDHEVGNVGNHAVVVVGKTIKPDGATFYMIRNSWGSTWADKGHCWISESFIKLRAFALITVNN